MQHTIDDINLLPTPTQVRKISQSLAMLDAIIMPKWDSRYFSFDRHWDSDNEEMLASMKSGEGDEYYILFDNRRVVGKVYSSILPKISSNELLKIETEISESDDIIYYIIEAFMEEEAFEIDDTSFLFWRGRTDKSWECRGETSNLHYLKFLTGDATFYKEWAEEYYEKSIDLDVVKKIMKHSPLKSSMVEALNRDITMTDLAKDIEEIGYPLWKRKGKRKTLPSDFQVLLEEGDIEKLKKVFDICELDAYGGYSKHTAIAYSECPDELVRWLVGKGLDVNILDTYNRTPLWHRAGSWKDISVFLELGADVNLGYPLHNSADASKLVNTKLLLEAGSKVNKKNEDGLIPLEYILQRCTNSTLQYVVDIVKLLLEYGSKRTPKMRKFVSILGKDFEFYRGSMGKEYIESISSALVEFYKIFDVEPAPQRVMHDGDSEIKITKNTWKEQNQELYEMLIPSSGCASTVQGEVIRIANRIDDEMMRNGGGNWDDEYKKMSKAFVELIGMGKSLGEDDIDKARQCIKSYSSLYDGTTILIKLAVKWVGYNEMPIKLEEPNYNR